MTKLEFTQRTGIVLTEDEYRQVEFMYLKAGNMDKDAFCKDYKKHHESQLLATYFKQSERLKDKLDDMRDERSSLVDFLLNISERYPDKSIHEWAVKLVGHKEVIRRKLNGGLTLWDVDREYIKENLQ